MSPQEKMRESLAGSGVPFKDIKCYGSQIVVTCWSLGAAEKWAFLLSKFSVVRGVVEAVDYNKNNQGGAMLPVSHKVWRTFARI